MSYITHSSQVFLSHINLLLSLQSRLTGDLCDEIFSKDLGEHIFSKWEYSDGNIINFFTRLDINNKIILIEWVMTHISENN